MSDSHHFQDSFTSEKEKLRSILGRTSKPTLIVDPTTLVPASRLVGTVGPPTWRYLKEGEAISI
jgi:hypothetical protein